MAKTERLCFSSSFILEEREGEEGKKQKQKWALPGSSESEKENTQLNV